MFYNRIKRGQQQLFLNAVSLLGVGAKCAW